MLNWVLGGQHYERFGQLVGFLFHGHVAFSHGFQKRRLSLRSRTIDLVGKNYIRKNRPGLELECTRPLIENFQSNDVRRQHIRRELNALKRAVKTSRESLRKGGLADAGYVFDQQMPARKQGDKRQLNDIGFAVNYSFDCGLELFQLPGGRDHQFDPRSSFLGRTRKFNTNEHCSRREVGSGRKKAESRRRKAESRKQKAYCLLPPGVTSAFLPCPSVLSVQGYPSV